VRETIAKRPQRIERLGIDAMRQMVALQRAR
jgi:hypothetical protein